MRKLLFVSFCAAVWCWSAKPMESIERYNVVLVHGADNSAGGFSCDSDSHKEAYMTYNKYIEKPDSNYWNLGNATKMLGAYDNESKLTHWLNNKIFEYKKDILSEKDPFVYSNIYLQRSFTNPAGSPFDNGKEIGWNGWQGKDKCSERRSLIEEAQEIRAKGRG